MMVPSNLGLYALLASAIRSCSGTQRPLNDEPVQTTSMLIPTDLYDIAWPPDQPGVPYKAQLPDAELTSMLSDIDPLRIQAIIEKLVSFGTRHTLSDQTSSKTGIGAARRWLAAEFEKYAEVSEGRMDVEVLSFLQGVRERVDRPTSVSNVIATLKGSSEPERFIVVR
jgi:hypothetical protein